MEATQLTTSEPPRTARGRATVRLLRPRQWIKNVFVFAPPVFAGVLLSPGQPRRAVLAFVLFCLAASAAYVVNDVRDVAEDRTHPDKRVSRPLAAGEITMTQAIVILILLYALLAAGFMLLPAVALPIGAYLLLNAGYSMGLKHVPVLDLFIVAAGFVLRVYVGARAVDVPLSAWMLITTLCLALYLAAIKRLQELRTSGDEARAVLRQYTAPLLERYAEMAASSAIVFYGLFVITMRPALVITIPFVLFGLFRYWYIVERLGGGESPTEAIWKDLPLAGTVLLWGAACVYATLPG